MEDKKIIIILLGVLIVMNIAGGIFLIRQQKTISQLRVVSGLDAGLGVKQTSVELSEEVKAKISETQLQTMVAEQKTVTGVITKISGNTITVSALVEALDKLKGADLSQSQNIPLESKTLVITVNGNTKFENKKLSALAQGDSILVSSDSSVVGKTEITASSISYMDPDKN